MVKLVSDWLQTLKIYNFQQKLDKNKLKEVELLIKVLTLWE